MLLFLGYLRSHELRVFVQIYYYWRYWGREVLFAPSVHRQTISASSWFNHRRRVWRSYDQYRRETGMARFTIHFPFSSFCKVSLFPFISYPFPLSFSYPPHFLSFPIRIFILSYPFPYPIINISYRFSFPFLSFPTLSPPIFHISYPFPFPFSCFGLDQITNLGYGGSRKFPINHPELLSWGGWRSARLRYHQTRYI